MGSHFPVVRPLCGVEKLEITFSPFYSLYKHDGNGTRGKERNAILLDASGKKEERVKVREIRTRMY